MILAAPAREEQIIWSCSWSGFKQKAELLGKMKIPGSSLCNKRSLKSLSRTPEGESVLYPPALRGPCSALSYPGGAAGWDGHRAWQSHGTERARSLAELRDGHGARQSCRTGRAWSRAELQDGMGTEPGRAAGWSWSPAEPQDGHGAQQCRGTGVEPGRAMGRAWSLAELRDRTGTEPGRAAGRAAASPGVPSPCSWVLRGTWLTSAPPPAGRAGWMCRLQSH